MHDDSDEREPTASVEARSTDLSRAIYVPPRHRQIMASAPSWFIPPPWGWQHPVVGRSGSQPDPDLLAFGQYVKRGRYLADMTQRELARRSGVEQGLISRLERALAPWAKAERLVKLSAVLGRALPLGYCPHEHWCQWQPAPPLPPEPPADGLSDRMRQLLEEIQRDDE